MKKCLFLLCFCLILAGCSAKTSTDNADSGETTAGSVSSKKEQTKVETSEEETGADKGAGETGVSAGVEKTEVIRLEDAVAFLEKFTPELTFTPMEAEDAKAYGELLVENYDLAGRMTEEGFGYVIAIPKEGALPYGDWSFFGIDDYIAAERWNSQTGSYESVGTFPNITAVYQGEGNRILYLQPKDYVMPDELQQAFYYQYCSGAEGIRHLQDMSERGVRFSPPDNGAYLSVERYEHGVCYVEYIPLTQEEEREIIESEEVISPVLYGNYGIQFYVSEDTYENEEVQEGRITAPALSIAKERCRFEIVNPSEIYDIAKAELKMKLREYDKNTGSMAREWEESETLSSPEDLKELESILSSSEPVFEGKCPYSAILTLTRKDGKEIVLQLASDSCDGFIIGSHAFYSPGKEKTEQFWKLFPIMRENTGWAEK